MRNSFFGLLLIATLLVFHPTNIHAYYTTRGQEFVTVAEGDTVQLVGIGLGGWLLPEGYMWGIRALDRPWQFEDAIVDLIGQRNARKFWHLYYTNFVTRDDVANMKSWGVNTLRVPLNANMLMPLEGQPGTAPYIYHEDMFIYLDDFVRWCEELEMGIIWDMHGAPGAQSAENISDSDGEARLWTEKEIYWPRCIDLWDKITQRYAEFDCIAGYDLLNEPLLGRYEGVDPRWLRDLYLLLTATIRETDQDGIIFIEGDNWAQDFEMLEPLDWDPHLAIAFHSYPPTHTVKGLERWDVLRQRYDHPLWHGETGEQDPPWEIYARSTEVLAEQGVSWNWWTHKKFELSRQPWRITRTEGFNVILDYWRGEAPRPPRRQARKWLFEQAMLTHTDSCIFLPGMVASLAPLDPTEYASGLGPTPARITVQPDDLLIEQGYAAVLEVEAVGWPLEYQWYHNGEAIQSATSSRLNLTALPGMDRDGEYLVEIYNPHGNATSQVVTLSTRPYSGPVVPRLQSPIELDGKWEQVWDEALHLPLENLIIGSLSSSHDLNADAFITYSDSGLYIFIKVEDDVLSSSSGTAYLNDGIEIYIDMDNSKSDHFGDDESQLRCVFMSDTTITDIGTRLHGIETVQVHTSTSYLIEMFIPFSDKYMAGGLSEFIGMDFHVNDNDSHTRNSKLAWFTQSDNSYQSPSNFGTLRLENPPN